jgi:hypothetical protein
MRKCFFAAFYIRKGYDSNRDDPVESPQKKKRQGNYDKLPCLGMKGDF